MARGAVFEKVELPSFVWHYRSWEDIKSASWFTKINWLNIIMLVLTLGFALYQIRSKYQQNRKAGFESRYLAAPMFPEVKELPNFDHTKTEPIKLRPFKPKYHLTMALETLDPLELILMDKNYLSRIKYRTEIMRKHTTNVVNISSSDEARIAPAIREYYTFITGTYLPLRYPSMFKLHQTDYETGQTFMLQNKITNAVFPASPTTYTKPLTLLETLGKTIDEDVLFLLPSQTSSDTKSDSKTKKSSSPTEPENDNEGKYHLLAYTTCCPSGFDPRTKLNRPLATIHAPVPGYASKLEASMDRFFANLPVGKYVKRTNWSITVDAELYAGSDGAGATHAHSGDEVHEIPVGELDLDTCFLRCERQTLFRLPESKAIVFGFKTYLYPLREVKGEGSGEELAMAVEGLKAGNVGGDEKGGMWFYKRGGVWGKAVVEYLRS